ncbi:MAG: hypothetical protein ACQXXL_04585 [Candidatus Methanosuratincola sp.]|jgi:hypothetical protein|nr:hypothetical protein [Candidatus Methanosuratincola sp.]
MPDQNGDLPESKYSELPGAKGFLVLMTAKTGNSVLLKQRRIPFTVLEMSEELFPFLDTSVIAAAGRLLGKTVISINEKKILSGRPWIARYGKPSVGEALTSLVGELFGALPPSESALVFSSLGRGWHLAGYRIGTSGVPDSARAWLERMLG